jgi:hypothetical protein
MNFFVIDPDPEADNDTDLVLAIQTALLNDCPDINQAALALEPCPCPLPWP